ncbi:hypothetical protein LTR78_000985 [Recurvomyces mirabilis]|uniref:Uncharacterized protein n=1 Tax=Recurvomyces mirabilis TaxID=574656 RepID=A0AAE0WWX3_9PEZI|nr:hypothetical protein LTR78_000985 [Recurvomyces mirabilis]KAK5158957.1 hypothetical protein LTS14_003065 [Recurvomyces mirabilis]
MDQFEAHEGSYDHQHRKRLKDLQQLTKDPNAASRARESERKANEEAGIKSINLNLSGAGSSSSKKKPVFKSTLQPHNAAAFGQSTTSSSLSGAGAGIAEVEMSEPADESWIEEWNADPSQMKANGWEAERFDPRFPAGECGRCRRRCEGHGVLDARESYAEWRGRSEAGMQEWTKRLTDMAAPR